MQETYGEYYLKEFLDVLHKEKRLIKSIFYDSRHKAWFVTVTSFKSKVKSKPIQLNLF